MEEAKYDNMKERKKEDIKEGENVMKRSGKEEREMKAKLARQ